MDELRTTRRRFLPFRWALVAAVVLAALWFTFGALSSIPAAASLRWRVELYARKATGSVPDLTWSELWMMTRTRGGFGLASFTTRGQSLGGSVRNPYSTETDRQAGERIFRERCAGCHGADGSGSHGPPLNRSALKHGDSELAIYRVIRDGVPDTAMVSADLPFVELWQVVSYVKALQWHGPDWRATQATRLNINVPDERIRAAGSKTDEWLTYSGNLAGHRYTPLREINATNVGGLRPLWIRQFETSDPVIEATPIVVDGVMFTTVPPATVVALDARTGAVLWTYRRSVPGELPLCCGRVNRGLAIADNRLYLGSLDGYLVAIDANSGAVLWEVRVGNSAEGFTLTGAPLVVDRSVVVGVAGGEFGIRGFLAAYDLQTGKERWKFTTIPEPGQFGHNTWENDAWRTGGGPTWITGSYDPALDLLYWGVGNPAPDFNGDVRPGDNLFTNSVVALHGSSGKLAWHFQFTPHDERDWDSNQTPILTDLVIKGAPRKVICWANRNGFYYVLDRTTGEYLIGTPFVELNWARGLDPKGRPVIGDDAHVSNAGRLTKPGVGGGTNWQNPAFDPARGVMFVPATEGASVFTKAPDATRGERGLYYGSGGSLTEAPTPILRALDAATGSRLWEYVSPPLTESTFSYSGLLATGGNLVLGASGGFVFAVELSTGKELWRVFLGGDTRAAPISFTLDGRQVIAVSSGRATFLFGL